MAIVPITYSCDVCKTVKGATNHWWMIAPPTPSDHSTMWMPWYEKEADAPGMLHLCGQECLLKKVAEIVSKQSTIPAPKS